MITYSKTWLYTTAFKVFFSKGTDTIIIASFATFVTALYVIGGPIQAAIGLTVYLGYMGRNLLLGVNYIKDIEKACLHTGVSWLLTREKLDEPWEHKEYSSIVTGKL